MEEQISKLNELKSKLNIEEKRAQILTLKNSLEDENLWKDWEKGQKVAQELSSLEKEIESLKSYTGNGKNKDKVYITDYGFTLTTKAQKQQELDGMATYLEDTKTELEKRKKE